MMLEKQSYGNLVFISTIEKARTKTQISKGWGLSVSGGPLYRGEANKDISKLIETGLIEKNRDNLKAVLDSKEFKKRFLEKCREKLDQDLSDSVHQLYQNIIENIDAFIRFLEETRIRKNVFSLENIKEAYEKGGKPTKQAQINPFVLFDAVIHAYVIIYSKEMIEEKLKGKIGEKRASNISNMAETHLREEMKEIEIDMRPFVDAMEKEYKENQYLFSPLNEAYSSIINNLFNELAGVV